MKHDIAIIGAGLFGAVAAAALRRDGHNVLVIDAKKEGSGSRPAACLMKPSWFSSMGKDKFEPSLRLLDELYGVQDLSFKVLGPVGATVHWCDPAKILQPADLTDEVEAIQVVGGGFMLVLKSGDYVEVKKVIVAAGVWSSALAHVPGLVGRAGVSFRWFDMQLDQGFINPWAPYRQIVGFNISKTEVWVGDGSAIKPDNWTKEREDQSYARCASNIDRTGFGDRENGRVEAQYGVRPYVPDAKPCFLKEVLPGMWVNTGGAKNGTIAAGWSASVLREALK